MPNNLIADDDLIAILNGEDEIGVVIRAHIEIELYLNEVLDRLIPYYEDFPELEYSDRVKVSIAMGLHPDLRSPLLFIGKIRNKYAHEKGYKLTKEVLDNFFETFSPKHQKIIKTSLEKTIRFTAVKEPENMGSGPEKHYELNVRNRFSLYAITLRGALHRALIELKDEQ